MKTATLSLIFLVATTLTSFAQMDEKFYFPRKELKPVNWENTENFQIAIDGDTITGHILHPTAKPKATVLFFHGAGGNVTSYTGITLPLVKANYRVIAVDFRGYGKSTGTPTHKNIAFDGQVFVDRMLSRKDVKGTKVLLYGASIGTQVATHLAKNNGGKIHGLILDGTISTLGELAAFYSPAHKDFLEKMPISPYSAKEDIQALDKLPKIFIHSPDDKEVPFENGRKVFELAPGQKTMIEYSGPHLKAMDSAEARIIGAIDAMVK